MDPTFFRIDWEMLSEVLLAIVVLAFFLERALSLLFEHKAFVKYLPDSGLKEPIAFLAAWAIVRYWSFDALSVIFQAEQPSTVGYLITAGIIAGGSKGSVKLFQDLLQVKSGAVRESEEAKRQRPPA